MLIIILIYVCAILSALPLHGVLGAFAYLFSFFLIIILLMRFFIYVQIAGDIQTYYSSGRRVRSGMVFNIPFFRHVFFNTKGVMEPIKFLIIGILETAIIMAIITYDFAKDSQIYNPFNNDVTLPQIVMFYIDQVFKGLFADFMEVFNLSLPLAPKLDAGANPFFAFFIFLFRLYVALTVVGVILILMREKSDSDAETDIEDVVEVRQQTPAQLEHIRQTAEDAPVPQQGGN